MATSMTMMKKRRGHAYITIAYMQCCEDRREILERIVKNIMYILVWKGGIYRESYCI